MTTPSENTPIPKTPIRRDTNEKNAKDEASDAIPPKESSSSIHPLKNRRLLLTLALFAVVYFFNCWGRDFWSPEEIEFAQICKEMNSEKGSWMKPTLGGEPYNEKPPLIYWSGLFFQNAFLLDPHIAYRLPSIIFGVLGIWVTFIFGQRFFNAKVGWVSCLIHGTSIVYFGNATWFRTDVPFAFGVVLAFTSFAIVFTDKKHPKIWKIIGALSLAFASLYKSPLLGAYLCFMPLIMFLWFQHGFKGVLIELIRARLGSSVILYLVLVLPWYVYMIFAQGDGFVSENIGEHHLDRLFDATSHQQNGFYYFKSILGDFLPWTLWLPLAIYSGFMHFKRTPVKLSMLAVLVTFVTLSLISSKQGKYLLPMWTPLCVLTIYCIYEKSRESIWEGYIGAGVSKIFPWIFVTLSGVGFVASILLLVNLLPGIPDEGPIKNLMTDGFRYKAAIILAICSLGTAFFSWKGLGQFNKNKLLDGMAWISVAVCWTFFMGSFLYSDFNVVKSGRGFAQTLKETIKDKPYAIYGTPRAGILYYAEKPPVKILKKLDPLAQNLKPQEELDAFLSHPEEQFLIMYYKRKDKFTEKNELEAIFGKYKNMYQEKASGYVGSRRQYMILSNRIVVE